MWLNDIGIDDIAKTTAFKNLSIIPLSIDSSSQIHDEDYNWRCILLGLYTTLWSNSCSIQVRFNNKITQNYMINTKHNFSRQIIMFIFFLPKKTHGQSLTLRCSIVCACKLHINKDYKLVSLVFFYLRQIYKHRNKYKIKYSIGWNKTLGSRKFNLEHIKSVLDFLSLMKWNIIFY